MPQILNGVSQARIGAQQAYLPLVQALAGGGKKLPKSKKVFDTSKVTDHHAIIPTGVVPRGLTDMEANVYDLIARRFISVFYPDCKFSTTTVTGKVEEVEFKVTGKEIINPGWRAVYAKEERGLEPHDRKTEEERTLPTFQKGRADPISPL